MSSQLRKGVLDICVLSLLKRKQMYGYGLKMAIQPMMDLSENTLYPLLRRLETEGYLMTHDEVSEEGRVRKYYQVTTKGSNQLDIMIEEWDSFKHMVDKIIEEGYHD